jgi:hypothetical protein
VKTKKKKISQLRYLKRGLLKIACTDNPSGCYSHTMCTAVCIPYGSVPWYCTMV